MTEQCRDKVVQDTPGMHVIPTESRRYCYTPLQTSSGDPSLNLRIWNAFSEATRSSLINFLRAMKCWMLSTAFFCIWEWNKVNSPQKLLNHLQG